MGNYQVLIQYISYVHKFQKNPFNRCNLSAVVCSFVCVGRHKTWSGGKTLALPEDLHRHPSSGGGGGQGDRTDTLSTLDSCLREPL